MAKALPIPDVAPDTPLGVFAAQVIDVRSGEVRALASSPGNGAKGVHDRRVAIRRLRTAIEVFEPALPKRARTARKRLKATFDGLGPRRDADVAIEALRAMAAELEPADMPGLRSLLDAFEAAGAHGAEVDLAAVLAATDDATAAAERARDRGGPPAADELRRIAARRFAAVDRRLGALARPRDADGLHDLRIAAKRLRYVLQSAAPALGSPAMDGAAAARELQSVLGDLHDCDVMLPGIRAHRRALRDADVAAVAAGRPPANGDRYRGVQSVEIRVRARRAALREQAAAIREQVTERLHRADRELEPDR